MVGKKKKKDKSLKGIRVVAGPPGVTLIQENGKARTLAVDGKLWAITKYKKSN